MMILGASEATNASLSFTSDEDSCSKQQQQQQQQQPRERDREREQRESSSSSLPLQTLVALASSLFDQATLEERHIAQEQQKRQQHECSKEEEEEEEDHKHQPSSLVAFDANRHELQTNITKQKGVTSVDSVTIQEPLTKKTKNHVTSVRKSSSSPDQDSIVQHSNFQCCTREGFLSRLRSVLNDASRSDVLSWMPNGKAFTIVSSRKFAKTGTVYELFGIRKMSSFLRRLNQLGFARVRDPTDPKNLDVFRKPGFVAFSAAVQPKRRYASVANTKKVHSLESPTSTLLMVPTMATNDEDTSEVVPRNPLDLSLQGSSSISGTARTLSPVSSSSSVTTASTLTANSIDSTISSSTPASAAWVCSTPETRLSSQIRPLEIGHSQSIPLVVVRTKSRKISHPLMPFASMPPSMPASSSGGPVLLRARSESHEESVSTPSSASSSLAPLLPPPKLILQSSAATTKTPRTANMCPLEMSPGTLQNLEVPSLVHVSQSDASATSMCVDTRMAINVRPPPQEFIVDYMKHFVYHPSKQKPILMEVEREPEEDRHDRDVKMDGVSQLNFCQPQILGTIGFQRFLKLQHRQEYLSLWQAAEIEAEAMLTGESIGGSQAVCNEVLRFPVEAAGTY